MAKPPPNPLQRRGRRDVEDSDIIQLFLIIVVMIICGILKKMLSVPIRAIRVKILIETVNFIKKHLTFDYRIKLYFYRLQVKALLFWKQSH